MRAIDKIIEILKASGLIETTTWCSMFTSSDSVYVKFSEKINFKNNTWLFIFQNESMIELELFTIENFTHNTIFKFEIPLEAFDSLFLY